MPLALAIAGIEAPSKPRSANRRAAEVRIRSRVDSELSAQTPAGRAGFPGLRHLTPGASPAAGSREKAFRVLISTDCVPIMLFSDLQVNGHLLIFAKRK